jgi:hypothetical protein
MEKPKGTSSIRAKYKSIGHPHVRPTLQIDSAGVHGVARGHGNFTKLKDMMLKDYNIDLEQQPGATPFWNALDLKIRQASQLEVGEMNGEARHREPEFVGVYKKARTATPDVKILQKLRCTGTAPRRPLKPRGGARTRARGAVVPSAPT